MIRSAFTVVALLQVFAAPLFAQAVVDKGAKPVVDKDVEDLAMVLTVAYGLRSRSLQSQAGTVTHC